MSKRFTINDDDREQWVNNVESWYLALEQWKKRTGNGGVRGFLRKHRKEIDAGIRRETKQD